ncbi:PIG-L family deacetylase [Actinotalea sp. K2]|uniref:PIG-L deacetylase family protein n=1 Tax=Actinotalea sp. K2 TaxID=2939438 RepID=UPI00201785E6|nr:PIG-L family deacetylase [Actinotalea sp. K2]MCL3862498.1 PIG-L family deacetylase [Actinotalea sp. K2]
MTARLTPGDLGTVLGVWAHPDDECYLMAGTAMLAAGAGSHVAIVSATLGEAGVTSDEERWPVAHLAEIRRAELAASLIELGLDDHTWLGLPDGGLADLAPEIGVGLVAEVVERVRPDTVLTFGPDGVTGHPDHVAVGRWAQEAAVAVMGTGCRVLAPTMTADLLAPFAAVNAVVYEWGPPPCSAPDEVVMETVLTGALLDRKVRSLRAQASQTAALESWMGAQTYRAWVSAELWVPRA